MKENKIGIDENTTIANIQDYSRYKENENLMASPYDWRLPPRKLEERDGFFTQMMSKVETLYSKNGNTPVVLMGHSMGKLVDNLALQVSLLILEFKRNSVYSVVFKLGEVRKERSRVD
jgi:hypothetical protein